MVKQYLINEGFALRATVPEAPNLNNPILSRQVQCGTSATSLLQHAGGKLPY